MSSDQAAIDYFADSNRSAAAAAVVDVVDTSQADMILFLIEVAIK